MPDYYHTSRVIKAPYARFVKDEERASSVLRPVEDEGFHALQQENVQAAYDELIAAAAAEANLRLRDAENEAADLLARARAEAEELLRQNREDGYQEGFARAEQVLQGRIEEAERALQSIVEQAERQRDERVAALEAEALQLTMGIAEKILSIELDRNDEAFLSLIRNAMNSIRTEKLVTLRVNPEDYSRFFEERERIWHTDYGNIEAAVVSDAAVEPYGAIIETDSGTIEAGLDGQLEQIRSSLEEV